MDPIRRRASPWARPLLWAALALACSASLSPRISARNLLLTPNTVFTLSATPGCFKWVASQRSIVEILTLEGSDRCPQGSASSATLITRSPVGPYYSATTMVLATPVEPDGTDAPIDRSVPDGLACEINIARVASLSISTTTREMVAQDEEIQWLEVEAQDQEGNTFSEPALRSLAFRWTWEGPADLNFVELEYTRQILDEHLASLSNERARAFYRVAVHATTENPRVLATASLLNRSASVTPSVSSTVAIRVRPAPIMLWPGRRVALPPGSHLQYILCKHADHTCWLSKDLDAATTRAAGGTSTASTSWSLIGSAAVGSVSPAGVFSAVTIGDADLSMRHLAVRLYAAKAPVVVAHPRALLLRADAPHLAAEASEVIQRDPPRCLRQVPPHHAAASPTAAAAAATGNYYRYAVGDEDRREITYMVVGEARHASLHILARDPASESDAMLLNGSAPLPLLPPPAEITAPHLQPRMTVTRVGDEASQDAALPLKVAATAPPLRVGRACSGAFDECRVGGAPPSAPPIATCVCREVLALSVGDVSLDASIDGSPDRLWPHLTTSLPIRIIAPLSVRKPTHTVPWVCAALSAVSSPTMPLLIGGSGCVRWSVEQVPGASAYTAKLATLAAGGSPPLRLAGAGTYDLRATDAYAPQTSAVSRLIVARVASLVALDRSVLSDSNVRAAITAGSAGASEPAELEAEVGTEIEVAVLFRGDDGQPLAFDSCEGLSVEWHLTRAPAEPLGAGTPPRFHSAEGGATKGLAHCQAVCTVAEATDTMTTGASPARYSCAVVRLSARSVGPALLRLNAAAQCGGASLLYETPLYAFTRPSQTLVNMCADSADAVGTHPEVAALKWLPSTFVAAVLASDEAQRPKIEFDAAAGLLHVSMRPFLVGTPSIDPRHDLSLELRCVRPHTQRLRIYLADFDFTVPVMCSEPLELSSRACAHDELRGKEAAGRCPVHVDYGASTTFGALGLWQGAPLAVEASGVSTGLPPIDAPSPLVNLTAGPNPSCDAAAGVHASSACAAPWQVSMGGARLGEARVLVRVPGHASCAPLAVRVRVRHAGFRVVCPSDQLALGASMRCHALPPFASKDGVANNPRRTSTVLGGGSRFRWRVESVSSGGGFDDRAATMHPDAIMVETEPRATAGMASVYATGELGGSTPFSSIIVTAVNVGVAVLHLQTQTGSDYFTESLRVTVRATAEWVTPPELRPALAPAAVVPRGVKVQLAAPLESDAEERKWELCMGEPEAPPINSVAASTGSKEVSSTRASVTGGVLHAGDVSRAICVRAASNTAQTGGATLEARMLIEVVNVAQVRLVRPLPSAASVGLRMLEVHSDSVGAAVSVGASLSIPTLSSEPATLVCGAAYDGLGRRILPSVLSASWLRLDVWPPAAAELSPAYVAGWTNGSCFAVRAGASILSLAGSVDAVDIGTEHPILLVSSPKIALPTADTFVSLVANAPRSSSTDAPAHTFTGDYVRNASAPSCSEPVNVPIHTGNSAISSLPHPVIAIVLLFLPLVSFEVYRRIQQRTRQAEEASRVNPRRDHPNVRSRASEGGPQSPRHNTDGAPRREAHH